MTENLLAGVLSRPDLPQPTRLRWQPLRLGLIDLFHYDSEEFWFHDGHLLLRGNNGTGKSKVLSLTLPLLFDAQLRPSRVEPDGDSGKKMAWNLLMGSYPRRIGYSWVEFGRREHDGTLHYLTLGVGLSAVAGRAQVDSWYFLIEGDGASLGPRIGQDIWLTTGQRQVMTRDRLRDALIGCGQVFESAQVYRRAVDERLFHLGQRRYDALMDTLIQLRQPQLSKKPDESGLSNALSESLPPLSTDLLADVAEALNQLEEDRNQLEEARRLEQAIVQFERRYRLYASMLARRQARELRQAQTGFDNASEARNRALAEQEQATAAEHAARQAHDDARQAYSTIRERVDTLQSDPANQDANRLAQAEKDAGQRRIAAVAAQGQREQAKTKSLDEARLGRSRTERAEQAREELEGARGHARELAAGIGIETDLATNPLLAWSIEALAEQAPGKKEGPAALHETVARRRRDISHLRQCHADVDARQTAHRHAQDNASIVREDFDAALERREQADLNAEREAENLITGWSDYCSGLLRLRFEADEPLRQLAEWAARPEGDNPAQAALSSAWQAALQRHAERAAALNARRATLREQRSGLEDERARLLAGEDAVPPESLTRAPGVREQRAGAPLWRMVDFHPHLGSTERAGLEAALESSGLLDAWVSPDGALTDADGLPLLDTAWCGRAPVAGASLANVLVPDVPDGCGVPEAALLTLLEAVAHGYEDTAEAEAWMSPDGRFRLGVLTGAWHKGEARYIGRGARERARQLRLEAIAAALAGLDDADGAVRAEHGRLEAERSQAVLEWQGAPSDRMLHDAIAAAALAGAEASRARQRMEQADARSRQTEADLHAARERLRQDAADLRLPPEIGRLAEIEQTLDGFNQAGLRLSQAASDWRRDWSAHLEQRQRQEEALQMLEQAEAELIEAEALADEAGSRFETLRESVGLQVDALRRTLAAALAERSQAEQRVETCLKALSEGERAHAVAVAHTEEAERSLLERTALRAEAIERLQRFSGSGLLASALPELALPENWTVDPALNLARRIEQALLRVDDDENALTRVQRQISEDLSELQRSMSALGHQAISEPNDWGITVIVQYQNRMERPDTLARLLADDIAQRSELLSAREREVLENHLQAEIAAEIQRLMRAADERVNAINAELHKRPTTTGVRYRLQWEPLKVDEGAPVGLDEARKRLLNTTADLWSAADRRTVGVMLQQQITTERSRADADAAGSSLTEQLVRALDYRRWHRFRIQRFQDGQWRKLSGPASSGERALGLTVPLFAAIASFYGHGGSPLAPRLMLLDEAFAGIDDTARAHCMGLIREFDLDFVITSEREWACYAELPGVAICQLQRREGIDAVHVSRWIWDGRAKRQQDDPDRRFPLA